MVLARPGMTGGGDFFFLLLLCPASALAVRAARNGVLVAGCECGMR